MVEIQHIFIMINFHHVQHSGLNHAVAHLLMSSIATGTKHSGNSPSMCSHCDSVAASPSSTAFIVIHWNGISFVVNLQCERLAWCCKDWERVSQLSSLQRVMAEENQLDAPDTSVRCRSLHADEAIDLDRSLRTDK